MSSSKSGATGRNQGMGRDWERLAMNPSAVLGSFYDATTGSFLEPLPLDGSSVKVPPILKNPHCQCLHNNGFNSETFLRSIGIDDDLWLNVMLNLETPQGMSSLINYSFPKEENIRFLYYFYAYQVKSISNQHREAMSKSPTAVPDFTATHVLSTINLGIQAFVILELPERDNTELDSLLEKICRRLTNSSIFGLTKNDEDSLQGIIVKDLFSNIPQLREKNTFVNICQTINSIKKETNAHRPLTYTFRSIQCFYPFYPVEKATYVPLERPNATDLRDYLLRLSSTTNMVSERGHLGQGIQRTHHDELERIRDLIVQIHRGALEQNTTCRAIVTKSQPPTQTLQIDRNENKSRMHLPQQPSQTPAEPIISRPSVLQENKSRPPTQTLQIDRDENKFRMHLPQQPSQTAAKPIISRPSSLQENKISQKEQNTFKPPASKPRPSYTKPGDIIRTKLDSASDSTTSPIENLRRQEKSMHFSSVSDRPHSIAPTYIDRNAMPAIVVPSSPINDINILLLGESGVGKSTFINALVNYLAFGSLDQAHSSKPLVVLPVSFLLTEGHNFEERTVRFGEIDPNEDHHRPGCSVTQQCRSYVFPYNQQTHLRIIDTPGMGDTRGIDQDDRNMHHILSFINQLPHLNAICILLKPNESRLNVVLRSYFTRLLTFLGNAAGQNIVFCFTNTRSTFFAPGNTGPLLRKMIDQLPVKNIAFKKTNTFCFDSESFRYLAARQNGIQFSDTEEQEYQKCWSKSSDESQRFLQYVCNGLEAYPQEKWQSSEHLQFIIKQAARPILESLRNTLRNCVIQRETSSKLLIELQPKDLSSPAAICLQCQPTVKPYGTILILQQNVHRISDRCDQCSCDFKQHLEIQYELTHELMNRKNHPTLQQLQSDLDQLEQTIVALAEVLPFLLSRLNGTDPILSYLNLMIVEEESIGSSTKGSNLNSKVCQQLKDLKRKYVARQQNSKSIAANIDLSPFYDRIRAACEIETVKRQLECARLSQEKNLERCEKRVDDIASKTGH